MKEKKSIISDREKTDPIFEKISRRIPQSITPNMLTVSSLFFAAICAFLIWFSGANNFPFSFGFLGLVISPGLLLALLFLALSSFLDALDGNLARVRNTQSKWGDYLDHAVDRIADGFFLLAIVFGGYICWQIWVFSIIGVFWTSNFGALAKGVGLSREYGGIMGRLIRLVILGLAIFFNSFCLGEIGIGTIRFTFLGWAMVIFAIGGIITACQRFYKTRKTLIKSESR